MAKPKTTVDVAEVERLASRGLAEYQVAASLGISADTMTRVKREQAGVAEALQRGKVRAKGRMENVAYRAGLLALSDPRYQASMMFWLKCNAGWKERQVIETVNTDGTGDSREDLVARIVALAGGGGREPARA